MRKHCLRPTYFKAFTALADSLEALPDVDLVIGVGNAATCRLPACFGVQLKAYSDHRNHSGRIAKDTWPASPHFGESLFSPDYKTARFVCYPQKQSGF